MRGLELIIIKARIAFQHLKFIVLLFLGLILAYAFMLRDVIPHDPIPGEGVRRVVKVYAYKLVGQEGKARLLQIHPFYSRWESSIREYLIRLFGVATVLSFLSTALFVWRSGRIGRELEEEKRLRGVEVLDRPIVFSRQKKVGEMKINERDREVRIRIRGRGKVFEWPLSYENRGMMVLGTAGSGKSAFVKSLLAEVFEIAREEGHTVVVFDRKGEYMQYFYDEERDLIFNPADRRTVCWNVFREVDPEVPLRDIRSIGMSFIPHHEGARDVFWRNVTRDLFTAIMYAVWEMERAEGREPDNVSLGEKLMMTFGELKGDLDRKSRTFPEDVKRILQSYLGESRIRGDIEISLKQQVQPFLDPYVRKPGEFSFRQFIREGGPGGERVLFISTAPHIQDAFRSLYTLVLDLMFKEILSLPDNLDRRVWVIIDEFPSLLKLESLERLLAEGRSKGSAVVLAAQDFTQIERIYDKGAPTIFNNSNTKVVFRLTDPDSAKFIASSVGQVERDRVSEGMGMGYESYRDSITLSKTRTVEQGILDSDVMGIPDLTAMIRVGPYPPFWFSFPYPDHLKPKPGVEPLVLAKEDVGASSRRGGLGEGEAGVGDGVSPGML